MITLFGIIALHYLLLLISRNTRGRRAPYITAIVISVLMTVYVFYMLVNMEHPQP